MAFTQQQIDTLKEALASGAKVIQYDGRRVEFNSPDDLQKLISQMQSEVDGTGGGGGGSSTATVNPRVSLVSF